MLTRFIEHCYTLHLHADATVLPTCLFKHRDFIFANVYCESLSTNILVLQQAFIHAGYSLKLHISYVRWRDHCTSVVSWDRRDWTTLSSYSRVPDCTRDADEEHLHKTKLFTEIVLPLHETTLDTLTELGSISFTTVSHCFYYMTGNLILRRWVISSPFSAFWSTVWLGKHKPLGWTLHLSRHTSSDHKPCNGYRLTVSTFSNLL